MPEAEDANERFNRLWNEIGAERIVIGDEDKGVEIVVDADLSLFGILDKLKEAARTGHAQGEISDDEQKMIANTLEECTRALSGGLLDRLRPQLDRLSDKSS
jgi:hypothetical protein